MLTYLAQIGAERSFSKVLVAGIMLLLLKSVESFHSQFDWEQSYANAECLCSCASTDIRLKYTIDFNTVRQTVSSSEKAYQSQSHTE